MKYKDIKALHGKSEAELAKDLASKYAELKTMQLERTVKQVKNTRVAREIKDDIARIQTVLVEQAQKQKGAKKV